MEFWSATVSQYIWSFAFFKAYKQPVECMETKKHSPRRGVFHADVMAISLGA